MDPSPMPMRPILKTATKTGSRTRFLADSASKYKSYSQSFHYNSYSSAFSSRASFSSSSSSSSLSSAATTASTGSSTVGSASVSFSASTMASAPVASAPLSTASSRERKRSDEIFLTPGDRRVTFSPFTKVPRKPKSKKALAESRKMTSGFVFSTGGEGEKRKAARKKQELQVMEKLYLASRKRSLGWKDLLLEHFTVLKDVRDWTQRCVELIKASPICALLRQTLKQHAPLPRQRRARRGARSRRERGAAWSDFDEADHAYMKRLALQSQQASESASALLLPLSSSSASSSSSRSSQSVHSMQSSEAFGPVPDLTPLKQGSFSSLLRREGIPVDEDESREKIAAADLRGVGQPPIRLQVTQQRREAPAF